MNYCKYSIIPTPNDEPCCSSCGKKLEGLPYYPQVMQLFLNIKRSAFEYRYVALGLGVPMCKECHGDITIQIEKAHDNSGCIIIFSLLMIVFMILGWAVGEDIRYLAIPILGGMTIYLLVMEKSKYEQSNELIKDKGRDKIDDAINQLKKNGWRQDTSKTTLHRDFSHEELKLELDGICAGGRYRLLDILTGYIVDYHDPDTLERILEESILIEEKDYDPD